MKKIVLALLTMLFVSASIFAQSDLQVLAIVKYDDSESITVKQLKKRINSIETQTKREISLDEKKELLNVMIQETLVYQAARKAGVSVADSTMNKVFESSLSQLVGQPITEKQFDDLVKKNYKMSSDEFFMNVFGLNKNDLKESQRRQFIIEQYVLGLNQEKLKGIAPTDDQIRMFYEANKASFIWKDMAKMLIVSVQKDDNPKAARDKANELRNKYADKKITLEELKVQSKAKDAGFIAGEGLVEKSQVGMQQLGIPMEELLKLFSQNVGFVSDLIESDKGYSFISIIKKYDAKMLGIGDLVQPETTITVYDYIRGMITNQLRTDFLNKALNELAESLFTDENVEMKKTGASLDKLLE